MTNTRELASILSSVIRHQIKDPIMLWSPPGYGKSSIVAQVAAANNLQLVDARISQMLPGDLRGLPAPDFTNRSFKYLPPDFLPTDPNSAGVLFLDEITQAPPSVQAITQQLILDRRVGNYVLPCNWVVWAAGNRQADKTGVYSMPTALANRFHHIEVSCELDVWKLDYALEKISTEIVSFLSFRPQLLHKLSTEHHAWPSPRSWTMADRFFRAGLSIEHAVGPGAAAEFSNYLKVYKDMPDLDAILNGKGSKIAWPDEVSLQYAVSEAILAKSLTATGPQLVNAMTWMAEYGLPEYTSKILSELMLLTIDRVPALSTHLMPSTVTNPKLKQMCNRLTTISTMARS